MFPKERMIRQYKWAYADLLKPASQSEGTRIPFSIQDK